ncbi:MAG: DUF6580 family putative transport protein [Bdellovibrionales bacterium]
MKSWLFVFTLVLVAGLSRLVPHPWNFTAVGAMALFAGSRMPSRWLALLAPFLALLWTDAVLGFHITMVYVYAAVCLTTLVGFWARDSWGRVAGGAFLSSLLFFVITNFGVWMTQGLYDNSWAGLVQCYAMALPFFSNQIAGDLFYCVLLFSTYEFSKPYLLKPIPARF